MQAEGDTSNFWSHYCPPPQCRKSARNFNLPMCKAAQTTVVEVRAHLLSLVLLLIFNLLLCITSSGKPTAVHLLSGGHAVRAIPLWMRKGSVSTRGRGHFAAMVAAWLLGSRWGKPVEAGLEWNIFSVKSQDGFLCTDPQENSYLCQEECILTGLDAGSSLRKKENSTSKCLIGSVQSSWMKAVTSSPSGVSEFGRDLENPRAFLGLKLRGSKRCLS